MPSLVRRSFAELLGTFALVFFGAGSVASKYFPEATYGIFGVAVAHGLVLAVMVTALLGISGGHLNPATRPSVMAGRIMADNPDAVKKPLLHQPICTTSPRPKDGSTLSQTANTRISRMPIRNVGSDTPISETVRKKRLAGLRG